LQARDHRLLERARRLTGLALRLRSRLLLGLLLSLLLGAPPPERAGSSIQALFQSA